MRLIATLLFLSVICTAMSTVHKRRLLDPKPKKAVDPFSKKFDNEAVRKMVMNDPETHRVVPTPNYKEPANARIDMVKRGPAHVRMMENYINWTKATRTHEKMHFSEASPKNSFKD